MHCKHADGMEKLCRPWSDCSSRSIWSGSTLFDIFSGLSVRKLRKIMVMFLNIWTDRSEQTRKQQSDQGLQCLLFHLHLLLWQNHTFQILGWVQDFTGVRIPQFFCGIFKTFHSVYCAHTGCMHKSKVWTITWFDLFSTILTLVSFIHFTIILLF